MILETALSALLAANVVSADELQQGSLKKSIRSSNQAIDSVSNANESLKKKKFFFQEILDDHERSLQDHGTNLLNPKGKHVSRRLLNVAVAASKQKLKEKEAAGSDSNAPDLGILASSPIRDDVHEKAFGETLSDFNGFRHMQEVSFTEDPYGDFCALYDAITKPIVTSSESYCATTFSTCETCEITYADGDIYNVKMDCQNSPEDVKSYMTTFMWNFGTFCDVYDICGSCVVDYDNHKLDFQGCSDGFSKTSQISFDDDFEFGSYFSHYCPSSDGHSWKPTSTAGGIVSLTLAAASLAPMLLV